VISLAEFTGLDGGMARFISGVESRDSIYIGHFQVFKPFSVDTQYKRNITVSG
jgi:hypothetical protein